MSTAPLTRDAEARLLFPGGALSFAKVLAKRETQPPSYRPATAEEKLPGTIAGLQIGPPGEVGEGQIRYTDANGERVLVSREVNAKLYDFLAGLYEVMADPGKRSALEGAMNGGAVFENGDSALPGLNDITDFAWQVGQEGSVMSYKTQDGTWHVVARDVAPELFAQVTTVQDTWNQIHASEAEGYTLAGPNDFLKNQDMTFGSPDELGNGLIRYENKDGKFIVSKDLSPQLYDEVVAKWEAWSQGSVDDTRAAHACPARTRSTCSTSRPAST